MQKTSFLILGGGLAGLTAAYLLSKRGIDSVVVESESDIGGLARTIQFGEFRYDIGGHRIFSDNPEILKWIEGLLEDKAIHIKRKSRIYLAGKFFKYPVRPINALAKFGLPKSIKIFRDYLTTKFKKSTNDEEQSFEDWIKNRFGQEMYKIFFKPYTEKVWGIPCSELSSDWARARISIGGLGNAVMRSVLPFGKIPRTYARSFLYARNGISTLAKILCEKAEKTKIMTSSLATKIMHNGKRIKRITIQKGEQLCEFEPEQVISSIPLSSLVNALDPLFNTNVLFSLKELNYRSLVCLLITFKRSRITDDNWIYFPEPHFPFARAHEPKNWDSSLSPLDKSSLCLEFFCNEGDNVWNSSKERLLNESVPLLAKAGFIKEEDVESCHLTRISNAYPILKVGYKTHRELILSSLGALENLILVGRTGTFAHYNMDQVIQNVMESLKGLLEV